MPVRETFFAVAVGDMGRATAFYASALDAEVTFASPGWSSLRIAGVRIGLFPHAERVPGKIGLCFVVDDLAAACAEVARAGGAIASPPAEVAPGVTVAEVSDPEGNTFSLRAA